MHCPADLGPTSGPTVSRARQIESPGGPILGALAVLVLLPLSTAQLRLYILDLVGQPCVSLQKEPDAAARISATPGSDQAVGPAATPGSSAQQLLSLLTSAVFSAWSAARP